MTVEVIGVDHIFVSVGDLGRSEEFYDRVMAILGFRKEALHTRLRSARRRQGSTMGGSSRRSG